MNPTGRQIAVEEIVTLKFKNSKIIEEWGVFDFAGLQAKLTVADEKIEN
jgi:predicted ester cyclase